MLANNITAYFDGACEPRNPGGHTGAGYVIKQGRKTLAKEAVYIGVGIGFTNNVGEACGAIAALERLLVLKLQNEPITVKGDSKIVISKLRSGHPPYGVYAPYCIRAQALARQFSDIHFVWIPREQNGEADELSKQAVDGKAWPQEETV